MILSENLQQARKRKKLSQRELGELVGVSGSIIGLYEKGVRSPRPAVLERLAQALDVDVDYLELPEDPDQQNKFKVQFDSVIELVNLMEHPENERKFLNSYAQLNLALKELTRAMKEHDELNNTELPVEDKLAALERIKLYAGLCCTHFANMTSAYPSGYADVKESFSDWQREKQKFDGLLTLYSSMNPAGRKIATNTMTALAATPEYQKEDTAALDTFSWNSLCYRLGEIREEKQLSLQEVGDRSGLGEGIIGSIEAGNHFPNPKELCYISMALEVRLTDLLPFSTKDASDVNNYYNVFRDSLKREDWNWTEESKKMVTDGLMKILEERVTAVVIEINTRGLEQQK